MLRFNHAAERTPECIQGDDPKRIDFYQEPLRCFVEGYRAVRALEPEDLAHLPLFLRLHQLVSFAKLHRSLEEAGLPDAPLWMTKLRVKLTAKRESYRPALSSELLIL